MAWFCLLIECLFFALAVCGRMWLQRRWTGSSGFAGIDHAGSGTGVALGAMLATAVVGVGCLMGAPVLAITHTLGVIHIGTAAGALGVSLVVAGMVGALWAQVEMGHSWRIGQNPAEETELVTGGPFRWVRNPIFTAMIVFALGIGLLLASAITLIGVLCLTAAIEVQVRVIEEPHLREEHAEGYADWAARTGRFLPYLGRSASR